jgi:prepilin-type N-terminal cleavage/methylation domain-containing protein
MRRTQSRNPRRRQGGFTLIELLVVVAVIGILASIAVAAYTEQLDKARIAAVANDLRTFETGFLSYQTDTGIFPADSHLDPPYHLPPGSSMENYLPAQRWAQTSPLGGNYNWEGPDSYPYAGISLFNATAAASVFAKLDEKIDDGNLAQGRFRITPNGRYTWILAE